MKNHEWINGNKMRMDSGHITFDRQTNIISPSCGCTIANTQFSAYVRAFDDVECNGYAFAPGHLQKKDLGYFKRLPSHVRVVAELESAHRSVKLYRFHHYDGDRRIDHGYVLTTHEDDLIATFITGPTYKSRLVINECLKYIVRDTKELDTIAV